MTKQNTLNNDVMKLQNVLVAVKGAGDLATGVIHRLKRAGFTIVATELPSPTVLRRTVAFADAVPSGKMTVEGITAFRAAWIDAQGGGQSLVVHCGEQCRAERKLRYSEAPIHGDPPSFCNLTIVAVPDPTT